MKGKVDKELCIGCGACETVLPEAFRIGDDGKAECYADHDKLDAAVASCPVQAISIVEENLEENTSVTREDSKLEAVIDDVYEKMANLEYDEFVSVIEVLIEKWSADNSMAYSEVKEKML